MVTDDTLFSTDVFLIKYRKVDRVEVDRLRAVEVLVLFHGGGDFSMRGVHISGDGEFAIGDHADRSRHGGCALQVFLHNRRGSGQSVLNDGARDLRQILCRGKASREAVSAK